MSLKFKVNKLKSKLQKIKTKSSQTKQSFKKLGNNYNNKKSEFDKLSETLTITRNINELYLQEIIQLGKRISELEEQASPLINEEVKQPEANKLVFGVSSDNDSMIPKEGDNVVPKGDNAIPKINKLVQEMSSDNDSSSNSDMELCD